MFWCFLCSECLFSNIGPTFCSFTSLSFLTSFILSFILVVTLESSLCWWKAEKCSDTLLFFPQYFYFLNFSNNCTCLLQLRVIYGGMFFQKPFFTSFEFVVAEVVDKRLCSKGSFIINSSWRILFCRQIINVVFRSVKLFFCSSLSE